VGGVDLKKKIKEKVSKKNKRRTSPKHPTQPTPSAAHLSTRDCSFKALAFCMRIKKKTLSYTEEREQGRESRRTHVSLALRVEYADVPVLVLVVLALEFDSSTSFGESDTTLSFHCKASQFIQVDRKGRKYEYVHHALRVWMSGIRGEDASNGAR
jgi:hypothetical protein